jgi:DMSO/TMAO reductase YedYZ molybdopterin-dependent catalytic subunit
LPRPRTALAPAEIKRRTPPGQTVTEKFPVLTYGSTPAFDRDTWDFRMWGLVDSEARWSYDEFMALPSTRIVADFHCVTTWSRLDNEWEGVTFRELLGHVTLRPDARFAMLHCDGGYTTNLSLEAISEADVMFAYRLDGEDLEPEHGWPLRSIVPKLYAWKSAKWVRGIEFIPHDRPGFWEQNGYHMNGDPWTEERYG